MEPKLKKRVKIIGVILISAALTYAYLTGEWSGFNHTYLG